MLIRVRECDGSCEMLGHQLLHAIAGGVVGGDWRVMSIRSEGRFSVSSGVRGARVGSVWAAGIYMRYG